MLHQILKKPRKNDNKKMDIKNSDLKKFLNMKYLKRKHLLWCFRLIYLDVPGGRWDSDPRISAWKADALPLGDARINLDSTPLAATRQG